MKPPICAICNKDFRVNIKSGGKVWFNISDEDKTINDANNEKIGFIAHPRGLAWFCGEHLDITKKYSHLELKEAFIVIRKELNL